MKLSLQPVEDAPSDWIRLPLQAIGNQHLERNKGLRNDNLLSLSYGLIKNKDIDSSEGLLPDSFETYQLVQPGDIIFRFTDLQNDLRSLRSAIVTEPGIITSAYLCFRPNPKKVSPQYLNYLMRAYDLAKVFYAFGGGVRQSLKYDEVRNLPIALPPRVEQDAIVEFLDREIAQIDAAVEKQRKLSTLLLERRQSLINAAVRFGLSSEEVSEFSTISWIGSYSKRFSIQRLKHNTYLKARVGWKGLTSDEFQLDSFAYLVTGSDFRGKYVKWEDCYQVDESRYLDDPFIHLADGDLLVTKDGSIGKLALVSGLDKPACLNSGVFLMRPKHSYTNSYMFWLLSSDIFREFVKLTSYGSTIQHLYQNVFENFSFPLPDLSEQLEIVGYLEEKTDQIDVMIEKSEKLVEVLSQRKLSLVGAAVTGKINLRGI